MARKVGFGDADSAGIKDSSAGRFRWFVICFLAIWLCGWSTGIFFAGKAFFGPSSQDPFMRAFLTLWLIIALFFWGFVVRVVFRLLRGLPPVERRSS